MLNIKQGGFNVIKHPSHDAYLLVMESKPHKRGILNHAGGGFDHERGDKNTIDTATEEGREETGLVVRPHTLIARYLYPGESPVRMHNMYESEVIDGEIQTSDEHPFVGYVSLEEILWLGEKGKLRGPAVIESIQRSREANYQRENDEVIVISEDPHRNADEMTGIGLNEIWIPKVVEFAGVELGYTENS